MIETVFIMSENVFTIIENVFYVCAESRRTCSFIWLLIRFVWENATRMTLIRKIPTFDLPIWTDFEEWGYFSPDQAIFSHFENLAFGSCRFWEFANSANFDKILGSPEPEIFP